MGRFWTKGQQASCEFNVFVGSLWMQFWFVRSQNDSPYETPSTHTLFWFVWHMPPSCPLCSPGNALLVNARHNRNTKQRYLSYWLWESSVEPGEQTEQEAGTCVLPVFWTCHHCCLPPALSPTDWFPAAWHMTGMRGASQVRAVAVGTRWCWRQSVSIQRWLEQAHKWMVLTFQRNVEP